MGGLRGGSSLASWVVAGTLAYYLWVRPSQQLRREQEVQTKNLSNSYRLSLNFLFCKFDRLGGAGSQEKAALAAAAADPYRYVEKRKPIPDPQVTVW